MSCDDCFKTVRHTGTPLGRTESIAGIPTYISEPTTTAETGQKKILLYFSDVFSPFYVNSQLLQDWFASNGDQFFLHVTNAIYVDVGYTVLGIDYFLGDRFETLMRQPGFVRETWRDKAVTQAREHTPRWAEAVRQRYGTTDVKYFAVGYCFGAPYVFAIANDPTFNLAAGAVAHPSDIYDGATKQLKADLIENCVEIDHAFPAEARRQAEDILVKNKAHYYFQVFSGASHGFGARGDPADDAQRFAKEECARGFLHWFNRLNTYIAEPPGYVFLRAHLSGWTSVPQQQDYVASFGFVVLGPDHFFGVVPHPGLSRHAVEVFPKRFDAVKAMYGKTLRPRKHTVLSLRKHSSLPVLTRHRDDKVRRGRLDECKYLSLGYCFGTPFVMDLAVDCSIATSAIAHPGFLKPFRENNPLASSSTRHWLS
ncbi:hypothetical protein J3R83DRAFT_7536 [Lanmaoa asiatica]|nr:hypothetical protein J3R83DRAFT_7536 [Lanmaoa asiatica]